MKPSWDKLGAVHAGSDSVVIGEVDCTSDIAKGLCNKYRVEDFPTLRYWNSATDGIGRLYSDERDFESLETFVKDKLSRTCNPVTEEDCDDVEKNYARKQAAKSPTGQKEELKRLEEVLSHPMKSDKRAWVYKRLSILKGLTGHSAKTEL